MDGVDSVYCRVGFVCGREDNFAGIVYRGKEAAERVGGQAAGVVEPVDGFVECEFGGGAAEYQEDRVGGSPYFSYDGVFRDLVVG